MTVNVYDYYRNKAALEKVRLEVRRSRPVFPKIRLRVTLSAPVVGMFLGLIAGLVLALATEGAPMALLLGLGALWGWMGGMFVNWARNRGRMVAAALRGEVMRNDGVRQLMGTRR